MSRARQPGGATPQVAITLPVTPRPYARVSPLEPAVAWQAGDYKISAQTTDHDDPQGGTWYICDGTAFPVGETTLIALIGANRPDAPGRALVMKGTHADVDTIGDNDGVALANRRPSHSHTFSLGTPWGNPVGGSPARADNVGNNDQGDISVRGTIGVGSNTDEPAYIVPGNLFIHS